MIAVDTNILVYAHRRESPHHKEAADAVRRLAEGAAPWAIPWPCIHEFISVISNPRIFRVPSNPEVVIQQIEFWRESPGLLLIGEVDGYWEGLRSAFLRGKLVGAQIHAARIYAICLAHGVKELWSADRDFSRMKGLSVVNPCLDS